MEHQNLSLCSAADLLSLHAALRNTIHHQLLTQGKWREIHASMDELDEIRRCHSRLTGGSPLVLGVDR